MLSAVSSNFDAYAAKLRALYPSSRAPAPEVLETETASGPNDLLMLGEEEDFRRRYAASIYVRPRQSPGSSTPSTSATGTRKARVDLRTRWNKQRYA